MTIYFYNQHQKPYGCFFNFSRHGFILDDLYWSTSEDYFQAPKFLDTPYLEQVRQTKTAREAANMGRDSTLGTCREIKSQVLSISSKAQKMVPTARG